MMSEKEREVRPAAPNLIPLDRLVVLIDGVFAITLTLLVLDLRPPQTAEAGMAELLKAMLPRLVIYLISFFAIANQWAIHVRSFRVIQGVDNSLVWLSLINLLFVTLLPASTALVGQFPFEPLAAACFSINSFLMSVSIAAVWTYCRRHRDTLAPDTDPRRLAGIASVWFWVSLGFLIALPVGWFSSFAALMLWVFWPFVVTGWWYRQRQKGETTMAAEKASA
jgi:uncharacterized membrane protein